MSLDAAPVEPISLGQLKMPVEVTFLRAVTSYTAAVAQMLGFGAEEIGCLELAVEEAFTNAVKHFASAAGQTENIHVDFTLAGRSLVIAVRERGAPFDLDAADNTWIPRAIRWSVPASVSSSCASAWTRSNSVWTAMTARCCG